MKLFVIGFIFCCFKVTAQKVDERILYVVDSMPILNSPYDFDREISPSEIETITVIADQLEIKKLGFLDPKRTFIPKYGNKEPDKVIFIITKEFSNRPISDRSIPTRKNMVNAYGELFLVKSNEPYTGIFRDYFLNGKKLAEGSLLNGLYEGQYEEFYQDGKLKFQTTYHKGLENDETKEFFSNGNLSIQGVFKNGKEEGLFKEWYSNGILKHQINYKNGKPLRDKNDQAYFDLLSKGFRGIEKRNFKSSRIAFNQAIILNQKYDDGYVGRASVSIAEEKYDEAIIDLDSALKIEPVNVLARHKRAIARIKKSLTQSNKLSKIDRNKICIDLDASYNLGDKSDEVLENLKVYCLKKEN